MQRGAREAQVLWGEEERRNALGWGWVLIFIGIIVLALWADTVVPSAARAPVAAAWFIGVGSAMVRRAKAP